MAQVIKNIVDYAKVDVEWAVQDRYSAAAREPSQTLCCPVDYDPRYLKAIPEEVLRRDYGCGDPSRYVREGDTVLDLGSGGGKVCFIAAQIAGAKGHVIGIDQNVEMLALARRASLAVAERIGFGNVEFRRGQVQNLKVDLDLLETWLSDHPVHDIKDFSDLEKEILRLGREDSLIGDASVDLVTSNCVLNLVREIDKAAVIREIFRVLKIGGRIAISDIVSDEAVPAHLKRDPILWSGCISGAFEEVGFLGALEDAGFYGIRIEEWVEEPFAVVEGIEFRSLTVTAHKGDSNASKEANQAVVYRGPWRRVEDDSGCVLVRGERYAVSERTHQILTSDPYRSDIVSIEPRVPIPESQQRMFDQERAVLRHPRESKGQDYRETRDDKTGNSEGCC